MYVQHWPSNRGSASLSDAFQLVLADISYVDFFSKCRLLRKLRIYEQLHTSKVHMEEQLT